MCHFTYSLHHDAGLSSSEGQGATRVTTEGELVLLSPSHHSANGWVLKHTRQDGGRCEPESGQESRDCDDTRVEHERAERCGDTTNEGD